MKWLFALVFAILVSPVTVFAQDAAVPPEGFDLIPAIVEAAQGGKWGLFASLIIMALVWLATKAPLISDLIKGEAKVWTASVAGTLLAVGMSIFTSTPETVGEWLSTVFSGLMVGLAATGMWELIKRKIEGKPVDADGDGKLD